MFLFFFVDELFLCNYTIYHKRELRCLLVQSTLTIYFSLLKLIISTI